MNNFQIEKALRSDPQVDEIFIGVFAADDLPNQKEYPAGYIANTEVSSQGGQHWVAFFHTGDTLECFDSFGSNPAKYSEQLKNWINGDYQIVQSEKLQSNDTTVCGQYCMFFILLRAYHKSYQDVLSVFTKNTKINDQFVCRFINRFFKLRTVVKDKNMLISQLLG